jgi:hypothetical protein
MNKKVTETRENIELINADSLKEAVAKSNFVDLDQELIDQVQKQVDKVLQDQSHNDQTAREAIEKWFNKQLLKNRDFDIKNLRLTVGNQPTVYIQAKYHCETRQFVPSHEPFSGQPIPENSEELWEKEPQNKFTDSELKWRRFGNNEIKNCSNCSATGQVSCGECKGKGEVWVVCGNCKGKGQIERTDAIVGKAGKNLGGGVVLRKEQCLRCSAKGKVAVTCAKCNGGGKVTCGTCSGRKELFHFDYIQGKSTVIPKDLILSSFSTLKDKWIKANKSDFTIKYEDEISQQNESRLKAEIPTDGKLLLEKYNIKVVPTSRVTFNFKGKERELFIIDNEVFANETAYFYDKKKTTIAISVGIIVILIGSFLGYQWYSSNKAENIKKQNELAQNLSTETKTLIAQEKYSDAANKLAAFDISFANYEQSSKDSINSALNYFVSGILISGQLTEVEKVYSIYYNQAFVNIANKELMDITHSIVMVNQNLAELDNKRSKKTENSYYEQKKWEDIAQTSVTVDSLLFPLLSNELFKDAINPESAFKAIQGDFESYLNQLLSFETTNEVPCSIETDLKTFETYISKIKCSALQILLEPTKKKLNVAQNKYKNVC